MTDLTARERHRAAVFARDPHECALSPKYTGWPGQDSRAGRCGGRLQADHILKVQDVLNFRRELIIRRRRPGGARSLIGPQIELVEADEDVLIADERNGWINCERHHPLKDGKLIVLLAEVILPDHYFGFVSAYGLEPVHDRVYQRPARLTR